MADKIQPLKVVCEGGLVLNENSLQLSTHLPGSATRLVNFESSQYGGYRRVEGYAPLDTNYPEVPGEGPILGVQVFEQGIIAARKDIEADTYSIYLNVLDDNGWVNTNAPNRSSVGVTRIRFDAFYWAYASMIIADGVNTSAVYDWAAGTWEELDTEEHPADPSLVIPFSNHMFFAGMSNNPATLVHSAPLAYNDFTSASGAGIINVGFEITALAMWRESLYIFGKDKIKRLSGTSPQDFRLDSITEKTGCVANDSIVEVAGDLFYLAQDGIRPIAGTEKIGDVELASITSRIQVAIATLGQEYDLSRVNAVLISGKSQVRFFMPTDALQSETGYGIMACLKGEGAGGWEFSEILGIHAVCSHSGYINGVEYVIHGDNLGRVYQQENGNSFDGNNILAVYETPFLDLGDPDIRKVFHTMAIFIRPEGGVKFLLRAVYDWYDPDTLGPGEYDMITKGILARYRDTGAVYGDEVFVYGGASSPIMRTSIEGSGLSIAFSLVSDNQDAPFTIQGFTTQYSIAGRR